MRVGVWTKSVRWITQRLVRHYTRHHYHLPISSHVTIIYSPQYQKKSVSFQRYFTSFTCVFHSVFVPVAVSVQYSVLWLCEEVLRLCVFVSWLVHSFPMKKYKVPVSLQKKDTVNFWQQSQNCHTEVILIVMARQRFEISSLNTTETCEIILAKIQLGSLTEFCPLWAPSLFAEILACNNKIIWQAPVACQAMSKRLTEWRRRGCLTEKFFTYLPARRRDWQPSSKYASRDSDGSQASDVHLYRTDSALQQQQLQVYKHHYYYYYYHCCWHYY